MDATVKPPRTTNAAMLRRKAKLRAYIDTHGGNNAVATAAGLTPGHITQLKSDKYQVGGVNAFAELADRLMLPSSFFDSDTTDGPELAVGRKVPVFSWEAVGRSATEDLGMEIAHSSAQFALRMNNDSMTSTSPSEPGIYQGMTLFVNPNLKPGEGSIVVARLPGASAATCRKLVNDSGFSYLRPLNPAYPMHKLTPDVEVLGVVVEVRMVFNA